MRHRAGAALALLLAALCVGDSVFATWDENPELRVGRVLAVIDSSIMRDTYSRFFEMMEGESSSHHPFISGSPPAPSLLLLVVAAGRGHDVDVMGVLDPLLSLKMRGLYVYDHVLLFAPTTLGVLPALPTLPAPSPHPPPPALSATLSCVFRAASTADQARYITPTHIADFVKSGRDVLVVGHPEASSAVRAIAEQAGARFEEARRSAQAAPAAPTRSACAPAAALPCAVHSAEQTTRHGLAFQPALFQLPCRPQEGNVCVDHGSHAPSGDKTELVTQRFTENQCAQLPQIRRRPITSRFPVW